MGTDCTGHAMDIRNRHMRLCDKAMYKSAETGFVTLKYAGVIRHLFEAVHLKSVEKCFISDSYVFVVDTAVRDA